MALSAREQLILLNRVTEIGSTPLRRVIDALGSVESLWGAAATQISQESGISLKVSERIVACRSDEGWLQKELAFAAKHQTAIVTLEDPDYPEPLRTIPDPPIVLYIKGKPAFAGPSVAVVGSRQASLYGLESAQRLGFELAERGIAVISGLALGIDAAAHRGALKANGRTIAVLGSGIREIYPDRNRKLAQEIVEKAGAVISEYPMQTKPLPYHFPRRNRIISGLSLGVVIVEARHRSGALITADCAMEQGREVFAVPGPMTSVNSQGTHALLKQGARLVTGVDDILEELGLECLPPAALSEAENRVLNCLGERPISIDDISAKCSAAASGISATLLQLELKGCIKQLLGKRFVRQNNAALGK